MKNHTWITETVDGGSLGVDDFWKCSVCGAGGGPVHGLFGDQGSSPPPTMPPFMADGTGLKLSMDCDESLEIIKVYHQSQNRLIWKLHQDLGKIKAMINKSEKRISRFGAKIQSGSIKIWKPDEE